MNTALFVQRYFVPGLAHASYLVASEGEAAIVDPKRDVDDYIAEAERLGARIVAILETHPHADFVSGHVELAERSGARIYVSSRAAASYAHGDVADGSVIKLGACEIVALETPGHSPDSVSWLVRRNSAPEAVFTGDTLFVGDVGRPDLRDAEVAADAQAGALFDSLHGKLLTLPDETRVYPAHGEGSLCGRNLSTAPFTTIGAERMSNHALQIADRAEFIARMTAHLPARPSYFSKVVGVNLRGASPMKDVPPLRALVQSEAQTAAASGAALIDLRGPEAFGAGHWPGSLNIGIESAQFSTWTGFFVPFGQPIVLIAASAATASKARLELARIGYDDVAGWVDAATLEGAARMEQLDASSLRQWLTGAQSARVLDVRSASEWEAGHIAEARHVPLPALEAALDDLPRDAAWAVICGSGYRSSLAASVLQRAYFGRTRNVTGGMAAFEAAGA